MKRIVLRLLCASISLTCLATDQPNILIIFTDDQGYGDVACYGNELIKTPRLDQMAQEGTLFTNFYAQPVCGPSRSALLTGRYPIRSQGWDMPAEEITFAELLKPAGYQTACIGKWDVSNRRAIIKRMPNAQGFDYYFGPLGANDGGIVKFHENNEPAGQTKDMGSLTRLYTGKAIDYLENRRNRDQPFLLYLAHTMMHTNIDASPKFKGTSAGGLYGDVVEEFDFETGRVSFVYDQASQKDSQSMAIGIRRGDWKLLIPGREPSTPHRYVMDYGTNDYELYNLSSDIGERWNLARDYPEIVQSLEAELNRFKATVKESP